MIKGIFALVCISLFLTAQCTSFKRIPFDNGVVTGRSLEGSSLKKASMERLDGTKNIYTEVILPEAVRTAHELKPEDKAGMTLFLFTSATGFCKDCTEFKNFKCEEAYCQPETDSKLKVQMDSLKYRAYNGKKFKMDVKIGSADSAAWELKSDAMVYDYHSMYSQYIYNNDTFGFIGLGADGDAAQNFVNGDHPLFSIKTTRDGKGDVIFGNDASLYDAKQKPQVINVNANWTGTVVNVSLGAKNRTYGENYNQRINFDLNREGLYLDSQPASDYYNIITNELISTYKARANSTGEFNYMYNGSLSALPDIVIGLADDQVLRIPSYAYTKPIEGMPGYYHLLISSQGSFSSSETSKNYNYITIGRSIMSQFYTIFEAPKEGKPTVTLYYTPSETQTNNGSNGGGNTLIWVIAIIGLGAIGYIAFKNKAANKLASQLNK